MKSAKGDLPFRGRSFLQLAAGTAATVFDRVAVVVREGSELTGPPSEVIAEESHEGSGPVFGVLAALRHSQSDRTFILAVDYPLITAPLLEFIGQSHHSEVSVCYPVWEGLPQSLCASYRTDAATSIERFVARGGRSITAWVQAEAGFAIPEEVVRSRFGQSVLWNVNRREDYDALRERFEQQ